MELICNSASSRGRDGPPVHGDLLVVEKVLVRCNANYIKALTANLNHYLLVLIMDPNYPLVPIFNFLSVVFILLILTRQLYSWNVGVCMYGVWMATGCFCVFVNTIIWKDNVRDVAIPWCEFGEFTS